MSPSNTPRTKAPVPAGLRGRKTAHSRGATRRPGDHSGGFVRRPPTDRGMSGVSDALRADPGDAGPGPDHKPIAVGDAGAPVHADGRVARGGCLSRGDGPSRRTA